MAGRGRLHSPHRRTRRAAEHAPGSRRAGLGVRMLRGDRSAGSARALAGGGPRAPRSPLGGGRAGAPGARLLAERSQPAGREGPPEVRPRGAHTPRDPGRAGDTHLVPWSGQHPRGRSICVGPVLEFEMTCVGDYWVLGQFFWSQRKRGQNVGTAAARPRVVRHKAVAAGPGAATARPQSSSSQNQSINSQHWSSQTWGSGSQA
uniref:Uncharacterized protein n=1 Tax=Pipistrellus kuhlii TaxID=59472 RepID=A0A7J7YNQ0_PIPKU|nr:hypothetical protein mPipKuh1_010127 [Pipistrellus kuhlii]